MSRRVDVLIEACARTSSAWEGARKRSSPRRCGRSGSGMPASPERLRGRSRDRQAGCRDRRWCVARAGAAGAGRRRPARDPGHQDGRHGSRARRGHRAQHRQERTADGASARGPVPGHPHHAGAIVPAAAAQGPRRLRTGRRRHGSRGAGRGRRRRRCTGRGRAEGARRHPGATRERARTSTSSWWRRISNASPTMRPTSPRT